MGLPRAPKRLKLSEVLNLVSMKRNEVIEYISYILYIS